MDMGAVIASFDDAFEAAIASLRNEPEDPEASGLVRRLPISPRG